MDTVAVSLAPSPGFCVKSATLAASECILTPPSDAVLEPLAVPTPRTNTIPKGTKVFANIAYDTRMPPPPPGSEDTIQRAMQGDDLPDTGNSGGWFVPLVVPAPREDTDKGQYCSFKRV